MKQANTEQKKWMSDIHEWACENIEKLYGDEYVYQESPFQLHHVMGRSAKKNKVAIGHWFIIPVPFELHDISSNHHFNVTHCKRNFTNQYGMQSDLFNKMVAMMDDSGYLTPDIEICHAIKGTRA